VAAQKKADRETKALAKKQAKANQAATTHASSTVQTTTTPVTTSVAKVKRQTAVVNRANMAHPADKAIGTDAKGRTIYQGPKGGKYYIDKNGNKEYVK
jgi:colicin import membrane protein